MDYPDCPINTPDKCEVVDQGFDKFDLNADPYFHAHDGHALTGGEKTLRGQIYCKICGNTWKYTQSQRDREALLEPVYHAPEA